MVAFGSQIMYNFGFLTNRQVYLCRESPDSEWESCSSEYACTGSQSPLFEYKPDYEHQSFTNNLFTDRDMVCWSDDRIATLG